jgi:hypothetical protein
MSSCKNLQKLHPTRNASLQGRSYRISVDPDDADRWLKINKRIGGDNLIDSKPVVSENEAIENILKRKKQRGQSYEN